MSYCGSDEDTDSSDSDSDEEDTLTSGEVRISVHILPEINSEQVELPVEEDMDSDDAVAENSVWGADVQRRCVTIECCQYEVAGDFECVCSGGMLASTRSSACSTLARARCCVVLWLQVL